MARWLRQPSVHLALWTLFVWGVRIRNARGAIGATLLSLVFIGLAIGVLALPRARRRAVLIALAGLTIAVWAVRLVDIALLSDHSAAFVVVHAVLAVASTALAVRALRAELRRSERPSDALHAST